MATTHGLEPCHNQANRMRKYVFILLFFLTLITPFVLRRGLGKTSVTSAGGKGETLIIITAHFEGIRREFAEAFTAWHRRKYGTAAYVDYRFYGGADTVKYFDDVARAHAPNDIDLVWGGGDYLFDQQLKKPGYLEPVTLDPSVMRFAYPKADLNGVALYDKGMPPAWFGSALSSFGILYNKDVLKYLKLPEPRTWRDLADPRYQGWLVMADPTRSASAKTVFMVICERAMADAAAAGRSEDSGWADGMGLLRQLAANARLFTGSSEAIPGIVASGDAAAAMCIDFHGRAQVDAIGEQRMGYIEPIGATAINPDPIAVARGAPHRALAIRFIEFVLSEEGQLLWNTRPGAPGGPKETALRRLPIAPSVYTQSANFTDKVNPFLAAQGFNTSTARKKTFPILGELMEFSCIDLLDELRATRAAIERSPHARELDAQLGRFPFDQKEAIRRGDEWKAALPARQLELQRTWTNDFRLEYQRLLKQSEQP
jgi:iron(III) transport system substrate-binding protein